MTLDELKNLVREMIRGSQVDEPLAKIWDHLRPQSPIRNDFTILQGNWASLKNDYNLNFIEYSDYSRKTTEIRKGILHFLSNIVEDDFESERSDEKIAAKLLVLTPSLSSEVAMRSFFPIEYFKQVDFAEEETWYESINTTDLVIFDNYAHSGVYIEEEIRKIQLEKLHWILKNTERCVVWFGGINDIVSQNQNKIYAANSRFALYARVREMLEFLKYMDSKDAESQD